MDWSLIWAALVGSFFGSMAGTAFTQWVLSQGFRQRLATRRQAKVSHAAAGQVLTNDSNARYAMVVSDMNGPIEHLCQTLNSLTFEGAELEAQRRFAQIQAVWRASELLPPQVFTRVDDTEFVG